MLPESVSPKRKAVQERCGWIIVPLLQKASSTRRMHCCKLQTSAHFGSNCAAAGWQAQPNARQPPPNMWLSSPVPGHLAEERAAAGAGPREQHGTEPPARRGAPGAIASSGEVRDQCWPTAPAASPASPCTGGKSSFSGGIAQPGLGFLLSFPSLGIGDPQPRLSLFPAFVSRDQRCQPPR